MRNAAGERVPAEGCAVVARFDMRGDGFGGDNGGADGEAVSEGFCGGEDVGVSSLACGGGDQGRVGVSPESAGTGETALYFIVDENGVDLVAALTEGREELRRSDVDTALALDRFDHDTARSLGDEGLELVNVVVVAVLESWDHGRKGGLVLGVRGGGECAHGAAVEGVVEGDELVLCAGWVERAADFAGELNGGFVGFRSGIGDEYLRRIAHGS